MRRRRMRRSRSGPQRRTLNMLTLAPAMLAALWLGFLLLLLLGTGEMFGVVANVIRSRCGFSLPPPIPLI